jgi:hypothetical protein
MIKIGKTALHKVFILKAHSPPLSQWEPCREKKLYHHAPMQCSQNALAYFATTITYARKMFAKSPPGREKVSAGLVGVWRSTWLCWDWKRVLLLRRELRPAGLLRPAGNWQAEIEKLLEIRPTRPEIGPDERRKRSGRRRWMAAEVRHLLGKML